MMRIITGTARGYRLKTLPGEETTRPTTERVKESIFSALQFAVEGRAVLDLFAGSGQMGLEALSRGAASCVFVDSSSQAINIVKDNAVGARLTSAARFVGTTAERFLNSDREKYDLVFLDPPYRAGLIEPILPILADKMREGGTVVCETDSMTVLPERVDGDGCALVLEKQRRYGKTIVWFFQCSVSGKDESQ